MKYNVTICGADPAEIWMFCKAFDGAENARLAGIACSETKQAQALCEKFGTENFSSASDAVEAKPDALVLLDGTPDKTDLAVEALNGGTNVLLGAPFARTAEGAKILEQAGKKSRGVLMSCDMWLHYPPFVKALSLCKKRTIGRVNNLRLRSVIAGLGGWDEYLNPDFAGLNAAPADHGDDALFRELYEKLVPACSILGPIEEMHCFDSETPGGRATVLSWKNTAHAFYGAIDVSWCPEMEIRSAYSSRDDNIEFTGASGIMWLNNACARMRTEPTLRMYRKENQFAYGNLEDDWMFAFTNAATTFLKLIEPGKNKIRTSLNSIPVMAVEYAEAAMCSASTGDRIKVK